MDYGIRPGQIVYTMDGNELGEIKEVRGDFFKVDVSMQPDYWLSTECIRGGTLAADRVTLAVGRDRLGDFKVKNPIG
jgi:hypothetical protein